MIVDSSPFQIGPGGAAIAAPPTAWRERFDAVPALAFDGLFAPDFCTELVARAAKANFAEDLVDGIGSRMVETPQRIGAAISLMLHDRKLLDWIEQATGAGPLRAVAGRLVQTRANRRDALAWHDDSGDSTRRLAVVINLSDRPFTGGHFELRRKQEKNLLLSFDHQMAGSMLIFAVHPELEHRVTQLGRGGPRRVYAGWFLSEPEHDKGALRSEPLFDR